MSAKRGERLRPHGKQAAYKTVDKAGVNRRISSEAARLDGRIDERYTRAQVDAAVADAIASAVAPKLARVFPSLSNGYSTHSGYHALSYYQNHAGEVIFRGAISGGTLTDGTVMFRLVSGVWPSRTMLLRLASAGDNRAEIDTQGFVRCRSFVSNFAGFDGVSFSLSA